MMSKWSGVLKDKLLRAGAPGFTQWLSKGCWSYDWLTASNFLITESGDEIGGHMLVWTCSVLRLTEHSLYHFFLHSWEGKGIKKKERKKKSRGEKEFHLPLSPLRIFSEKHLLLSQWDTNWREVSDYTQRREEWAGEGECKRESS